MKILVIKEEGIGNAIQATPMLLALRRKYPSALIDVLASDRSIGVLDRHPAIDNLLSPGLPITEKYDYGILTEWASGAFVSKVIPHINIQSTGGLILYSEHNCEQGNGEEKLITSDAPNFGEKEDGSEFVALSAKFFANPGDIKALFYAEEDYGGDLWELSSDYQDCLNLNLFLPIVGALEAKSARIFWQLPGVYLCTDIYEQEPLSDVWMCQGEEKHLGSSTALLDTDLNDKIKALRLRPAYTTVDFAIANAADCSADVASGGLGGEFWEQDGKGYCTYPVQFFGAVLHEHADFTGQCELFQSTATKNIFNLISDSNTIGENTASSVTIFAEPYISFVSSTAGVWLCEDVNPKRDEPTCHGPYQAENTPDIGNAPTPPELRGLNDKISSIIIDGEYLAILFEHTDQKGRCEVFTDSDSNFRDNPIGRCNCAMGNWRCEDCLSSFIIISTAQ